MNFRGINNLTLDAKGRMAMPARYRERLLEGCGGRLVVTVDQDHCLLVYPLPEWEIIESKLIALPSLNKQARLLQRLLIGYATELELDGQGKPRYADEAKCIECGLCHIVCEDASHQAIAKHKDSSGKRTYTVIDEECVGCNLCVGVCPIENCITMKQLSEGDDPRTAAAVRAERRAYDGAPPVVPHEDFGMTCVSCHNEQGVELIEGTAARVCSSLARSCAWWLPRRCR